MATEASSRDVECHLFTRKKWGGLFRIKEELLPQAEEFKYLGVLFTCEERMEWEIKRQIAAASAVMRTLHRSIVVKRELS